MKKILLAMAFLTAFTGITMAQNALNNKADNIIGTYMGKQGNDKFKAKIVKLTNGTYRGQVIWMENDKDAKGNKKLDTKNPDKKLRNTPADQIVLFTNLKYNAEDNCWDGTKIYDPQRGITAKLKVEFTKEGKLRLKGSKAFISESVYWDRIKE